MKCDCGDISSLILNQFKFNLLNLVQKSNRKLSPQSHSIKFGRKWKIVFLSVEKSTVISSKVSVSKFDRIRIPRLIKFMYKNDTFQF